MAPSTQPRFLPSGIRSVSIVPLHPALTTLQPPAPHHRLLLFLSLDLRDLSLVCLHVCVCVPPYLSIVGECTPVIKLAMSQPRLASGREVTRGRDSWRKRGGRE